jgi:hypothetical protein
MSDIVPTEQELFRKALFVHCETKADLHRWIRLYLDVDLPDHIVDRGPGPLNSNSTPMDMIWSVYQMGLGLNGQTPQDTMFYAPRDGLKTVSAAVLEVLAMFHMRRSVGHMAAIKPQSQRAQGYVKKFFARSVLHRFVTEQNESKVSVAWYHNKSTGEHLTTSEWTALSDNLQLNYVLESYFVEIVVCTMAGANSLHVPFMVIDEVDVVVNKDAYEEAKFIPSPFDGNEPITIYISTRKSAGGLVQKEIDNASESGLVLRHWDILDVTQRCPTKLHEPEKPRLTLYRSDETLKTISEADYLGLDSESQKKYARDTGFWGCYHNCKIFSICQGKLATQQKSKSKWLKPVSHVIKLFLKATLEKVKAQMMCWKPYSIAQIYPNLDPEVHMLTAAQIAERITGEPFPETFSRDELIYLMKSRDLPFYAGMDWGYTHNFAAVLFAVDGNRAYVVDSFAIPGIELEQKIEFSKERLGPFDPVIYADPSEPGSIKSFRKKGFRMRDWSKKPGSVIEGIDAVRSKLMPASHVPTLFFLKTDDGICDPLVARLKAYEFLLDANNKPTDIPNDDDDDDCDALRYGIMNVFAPKGKVIAPPLEEEMKGNALSPVITPVQKQQIHWKQIVDHLGGDLSPADPTEPQGGTGKKGGFHWSI